MDVAIVEEKSRKAFATLKPICVNIMQPSTFRINKRDKDNPMILLLDVLQTIGKEDAGAQVLSRMFEYITFPLVQLLKYPSPTLTAVECALYCLAYLLETCPPPAVPLPLYRDLLVILPLLISQGHIPRKEAANPPEELKAAGVRCILALVRKPPQATGSTDDTNDEPAKVDTCAEKSLDRPEYQSAVALIVVVLLEILEAKSNLDLQLSAVEAIANVAIAVGQPHLVVNFLPGVSSTLAKVIVRDEKESHKLIIKCLDTIAKVVKVVLNDEACESLLAKDVVDWNDLVERAKRETRTDVDKQPSVLSSSVSFPEEEIPRQPRTIPRDRKWLETTSIRLNRLFAHMFTIRSHDHWKVRLSFVRFCSTIILYCSRSLASSAPLLVETLVRYVSDDYSVVADECQKQLEAVATKIHERYSLSSVLKENFVSLMMALPGNLMLPDDRKKLESLQIANGHILLLKHSINSSLGVVLSRSSLGLLKALTFDTSDVKLVEDRSAGGSLQLLAIEGLDSDTIGGKRSDKTYRRRFKYAFPRKRFQYYHEEKVVLAMSQLWRLLGYYGDVGYLADRFLEHLRTTAVGDFQAQAIYIIKEISLGAAGIGINGLSEASLEYSQQEHSSMVKRVIKSVAQDFLRSPVWESSTNIADALLLKELSKYDPYGGRTDKALEAAPSIPNLNAIILKTVLLLEGLATSAQILRTDFRLLLMDALYTMLEKVADRNRAVSDAAMAALIVVADACGYSSKASAGHVASVSNMILANVDYVVNDVSRRLRHIALNPRAPLVLKASIRIAGSEIVPYMNDSFDEIMDVMDEWHVKNEHLVSTLIGVLHELVGAMKSADDGNNFTDQNAMDPVKTHEEKTSSPEQLVPAQFVGCRKEMLEYFLKGIPRENALDDAADKAKEKTSIEEIEKFFTDRAAASEHNDQASDPLQEPSSPPGPSENPLSRKRDAVSDDKETPPTPAQAITLKTLDKIIHYLSGPNPRVRSQSLSIITSALPVLQSRPKDLNPIIHKFWPSVVRRLADQEHYVIAEALHVVSTMCRLSRDFVAKRVGDDLVPRFVALAESFQVAVEQTHADQKPGVSRAHSAHRDKHIRSITTTQLKVHVASLNTMAELLCAVPLSNNGLQKVVDCVVPFLNSRWYAAEVVQAAVRVLKAVVRARGAGDLLWLGVWVAIGGRNLKIHNDGMRELGLSDRRVPLWMVEKWRSKGTPEDFLVEGMEVLKTLGGNDNWVDSAGKSILIR